jgi:recombination associated protein RdgC
VTRHTKAGKQCSRLALTWTSRVSLVLTDKLELKRIRPLDVVKESAAADDVDADARFASDLTLMTGELSKLLADVVAALGGEVATAGVSSSSDESSPFAPVAKAA